MKESTITIEQLEKVLDEKVRPSLALHNGNVEIYSFENDVLRVKLTGQCSGCPSAHSTNEELIATPIKEIFPEIKDVLLVEGVSDDLLNFARRLLKHEV